MILQELIHPQPPAWAEDAQIPAIEVISSVPLVRRLRHDAARFWLYAGDGTTATDAVKAPRGGLGDVTEYGGERYVIAHLGAEKVEGTGAWVWTYALVGVRDFGTYQEDPKLGLEIAKRLGLVPNCPKEGCVGGRVQVGPMELTCRTCGGLGWSPRPAEGSHTKD